MARRAINPETLDDEVDSMLDIMEIQKMANEEQKDEVTIRTLVEYNYANAKLMTGVSALTGVGKLMDVSEEIDGEISKLCRLPAAMLNEGVLATQNLTATEVQHRMQQLTGRPVPPFINLVEDLNQRVMSTTMDIDFGRMSTRTCNVLLAAGAHGHLSSPRGAGALIFWMIADALSAPVVVFPPEQPEGGGNRRSFKRTFMMPVYNEKAGFELELHCNNIINLMRDSRREGSRQPFQFLVRNYDRQKGLYTRNAAGMLYCEDVPSKVRTKFLEQCLHEVVAPGEPKLHELQAVIEKYVGQHGTLRLRYNSQALECMIESMSNHSETA